MGAYDSIYARCNCDWPEDERCKALPDDQTRWFNHLLWLESVRQKSSILPHRFDASHWAKRLSVSVGRIEEMVKAMAAEELIGWSQDGCLVVRGTQKNHPKLKWERSEQGAILNPFKKPAGWRFTGYPEISPDNVSYPEISPGIVSNPVKSPTGEESIGEKRRGEERIARATPHPPLSAAPPEDPGQAPGHPEPEPTRDPAVTDLQQRLASLPGAPAAPAPNTDADTHDRDAFAALIVEYAYPRADIIACIDWMLAGESPDAVFWQGHIRTVRKLTQRAKSTDVCYFSNMHAQWRAELAKSLPKGRRLTKPPNEAEARHDRIARARARWGVYVPGMRPSEYRAHFVEGDHAGNQAKLAALNNDPDATRLATALQRGDLRLLAGATAAPTATDPAATASPTANTNGTKREDAA